MKNNNGDIHIQVLSFKENFKFSPFPEEDGIYEPQGGKGFIAYKGMQIPFSSKEVVFSSSEWVHFTPVPSRTDPEKSFAVAVGSLGF